MVFSVSEVLDPSAVFPEPQNTKSSGLMLGWMWADDGTKMKTFIIN